MPPALRPHVERMGHELLAQAGGTRSTNDNLTKDGRTISCEWYNTPLVDESGQVLGVASLVQDVTERVALEERLRQSQKMEAVGRLAGGVAHDFNNLLTVIMGYSQILTDGLPAVSRLKDATAQIRSAADRAAGITRQLLAFSRKQVLSPRVIDLNDIMLNLDSLLRRLIGEDIEVLTVPGRRPGRGQSRSRSNRAGHHEPGPEFAAMPCPTAESSLSKPRTRNWTSPMPANTNLCSPDAMSCWP